MVQCEIDGELRRFATTTDIAAMCGVDIRQVSRWLQQGKIPAPEYEGENGTRLWTPTQAREILGAYLKRTTTKTRQPKRSRQIY